MSSQGKDKGTSKYGIYFAENIPFSQGKGYENSKSYSGDIDLAHE